MVGLQVKKEERERGTSGRHGVQRWAQALCPTGQLALAGL